MSMFDTFLAPLPCPIDAVVITSWQGKDGPCALWTFALGRTDALEADEGRVLAKTERQDWLAGFDATERGAGSLSERDQAAGRRDAAIAAIDDILPAVFSFHAACGDHWLEAIGETDGQARWVRARIVRASQVFTHAAVKHTEELPDGRLFAIHQTEMVELFRAGEHNMTGRARREHLRAERQAALPAHGGSAVCQRRHVEQEGPPPAVSWKGGFLCAACETEALLYDGPASPEAYLR